MRSDVRFMVASCPMRTLCGMSVIRRGLRTGFVVALIGAVGFGSPTVVVAADVPHPTPATTVAAAVHPMSGWGGHQSRVVRVNAGVFTTYLTGTVDTALRWHLTHLEPTGTWREVATGLAGREPAHLLGAPDGTISLIAAPNGAVTLWQGRPAANGDVRLTSSPVPGMEQAGALYLAAGISPRGHLCVMVTPSPTISVACRRAGQATWSTSAHDIGLRYAYAYVFPRDDGTYTIVATRDVTWDELGWVQPPGGFDYDFTAWRVMRGNFAGTQFAIIHESEEAQTAEFLDVYRNAQTDAFVDRAGRIHVLSWRRYLGSQETENWHTMLSPSGALLAEHRIFANDGFAFMKLTQSPDGRFWMLMQNGFIVTFDPMTGADGTRYPFDLTGDGVDYAGFAITAPRGGARRCSVTLDAVFPSYNGAWRYEAITFPMTGKLPWFQRQLCGLGKPIRPRPGPNPRRP
jgi:hypothetical protein